MKTFLVSVVVALAVEAKHASQMLSAGLMGKITFSRFVCFAKIVRFGRVWFPHKSWPFGFRLC